MRRYTADEIEALTNWDGMLCKPPFRTEGERRQYFSRHIERMLWRTFTPEQWRELAEIVDDLKIPEKLRRATKFLIPRHT